MMAPTAHLLAVVQAARLAVAEIEAELEDAVSRGQIDRDTAAALHADMQDALQTLSGCAKRARVVALTLEVAKIGCAA